MQASENCSPVRDNLRASAEPGSVGRADRVGVEAGAVGQTSAARAAVAKMHGGAVVGMADDGEERAADDAAAVSNLDEAAD